MQAVKRPRGLRYRLKRGPKIVLSIVLLSALGFFFYQSQQPKVVFLELNTLEYGATSDEVVQTLVDQEHSRYDVIEIVDVDTSVVSNEEEGMVTGTLVATFKDNSKSIRFNYFVVDSQAPVVQVEERAFDYSDANAWQLFDALDAITAYDVIDGDLEVTFSFDEMIETRQLNIDEMKAVIKDLQYRKTYPFTVSATDNNGNTTSVSMEVFIADGGMREVAQLDEAELDRMLSSVSASYATVFSVNNDTVLYETGYENKIYPASMTKMMTVYAALEILASEITPAWNNKEVVTLDTLYTVPTTIDWIHNEDASNAGIWGNDVVSIRDLLYGIMLPSGADAVLALSEALTGSSDGIVNKMNEIATSLGMSRTHYVNGTGLHHNNHYTSMKDLVILMKTAWANESYRTIMSTAVYVSDQAYVNGNYDVFESYSLTILAMLHDTDVVASKSGYTNESGRSLASVVVRGEDVYFVIVNQSKEDGIGLSAVTDTMALIKQYIP